MLAWFSWYMDIPHEGNRLVKRLRQCLGERKIESGGAEGNQCRDITEILRAEIKYEKLSKSYR